MRLLKSSGKDHFAVIICYLMLLCAFILDPYKLHKIHLFFWVFMFAVPVSIMLIRNIKGESGAIRTAVYIVSAASLLAFGINGMWHAFYAESLFVDPYELYDGRPVTLIERAYFIPENEATKEELFQLYYLKGRDIVICGDDDTEGSAYLKQEFPDYLVDDNSILRNEPNPQAGEAEKIFRSYPYVTIEKGNRNCYFIVDDGMTPDGRIVFFEGSDGYYFCSEELYDSGKENEGAVVDHEAQIKDAYTRLGELSCGSMSGSNQMTKNAFVQVAAVLLLSLIGRILFIVIWGDGSPLLQLAFSLPFGAVLWSVACVILTLLRIRLSLIPMLMIIFAFLVPLVFLNRNKMAKIRIKELTVLGIPYFLILLYFSCTRISFTVTYDALKKCEFGLLSVICDDFQPFFSHMSSFGIIEPYSHALGYMLGGDYLYVLYPMFFVSTFCLFVYGIMQYANGMGRIKDHIFDALIPVLVGSFFLLINADYRFGAFLALSHDIMAFYFLAIFVGIVLKEKNKLNGLVYILSFSAGAIMITRTEGIIYILFALTIMVGYVYDKEVRKACLISCASALLWILIQLFMFTGEDDSYFFTPTKAVLLSVAILACIGYVLLFDKVKRMRYFPDHYGYFYILGLLICNLGIGLFYAPGLARDNIPVFYSHLSSYIEYGCNSGYLWFFVFLWLAVLCMFRNRLADMSINVVWGYVLLVFLILLLRGDLSIHEGIADSGRRMLVHIMPVSIWLISVSIMDIMNKVEDKCNA